jgi:hypothetical protein
VSVYINNVICAKPPRRPPGHGRSIVITPQFQTFVAKIFPIAIPSGSQVFTPALISTSADMQLFIAGVQREWMVGTFNIDLILGAKGKATFQIYSATTYRPSVFDEVIFYRKGVRRFGGFVQSLIDDLIPMAGSSDTTGAHIISVTCVDYNGYMDRVIVAKLYTIPIGSLAWIIIFDMLQEHLTQFGVTFAGFGFQGAGVGEVLFHYVTMAQAVAQLVSAGPSTFCWIDSYKRLHFAQAVDPAPGGFGTAPYLLTDSSHNYATLQLQIDGTLYRNKQWVLPSANVLSLRVETFTGDGSTTGFFTLYVLNQPPLVTVNGNLQVVATLGGPYPAGWQWYFIVGGQGVFQRPGSAPLTAADTLEVAYPNPFALAVSAENDTEIAAHGLVEAALQPQNVIDVGTAQVMASGTLAAYCPDPPSLVVFTASEIDSRTGQYASGEGGRWLSPGMQVSVTKTIPPISGTFIVQEISSTDEGAQFFRHTITMRSNNGDLSTQTGYAALAGQALAASNNNASEELQFELALTVAGVTNPGLSTGAVLNRQIYNYDGVLSYWSILFAANPPTGADIVIDALLNGVSIFPPGAAQKIVLPAGQSTEAQGYLFSANNLPVHKGDVLTLNVLQVGATIKGSDGLVRIVTVR